MPTTTRRHRLSAVVAATCLASTAVVVPAAAETDDQPRPIVFVHGQSGSASQFATQFLRLSSNGYPPELLFAYE